MSSYGHIRDLRKRGMSVEIDSGFSPLYEIPAEKKELVRQLKSAAKDADIVWLASDEDREGEAIAWHLAEVLELKPENTKRIVFHEITKPAILHAIENPRGIDLDRVNAQQARRVLDRIVGFELSPILWKKIKPALSAGRVQSVAVRLICEREKEIEAFTPEPFFRVNAIFNSDKGDSFKAELKRRLADEKEAGIFLKECADTRFSVTDLSVRPVKRSPAPPFTTSTLQQEAGKRLGFSVNRTMSIAQKLYEDGRITYMRTDSTNLSELALKDIAAAISGDYAFQRRSGSPRGYTPHLCGQPHYSRHRAGEKTLRPYLETRRSLADERRRTRKDQYRDCSRRFSRRIQGRRRSCDFRRFHESLQHRFRLPRVLSPAETRERGTSRSPRDHGHRALHSGSPPIHGSFAREEDGRPRHRAPVHLCPDHLHHPIARLYQIWRERGLTPQFHAPHTQRWQHFLRNALGKHRQRKGETRAYRCRHGGE